MEKQQITHKVIPIRKTADLSIEALQARREWQDILKVMKENNLQPRLWYPARSHLDMKEKSKALQTSKSWKNSAPPNQLSNKCYRIFSRQEKQKGSYTRIQNNKVNGNKTIPINNYLKCKWVECPNQKTKTDWMDTKARPLHMLSTRDPPQDKGHIENENKGLEKNIFIWF